MVYLCRYGNTSPHRLRRNTVLTLRMKGKEEKATNTSNRAASKRLSNVLKRHSPATRGGLSLPSSFESNFRGLLNFLCEPDSETAGVGWIFWAGSYWKSQKIDSSGWEYTSFERKRFIFQPTPLLCTGPGGTILIPFNIQNSPDLITLTVTAQLWMSNSNKSVFQLYRSVIGLLKDFPAVG